MKTTLLLSERCQAIFDGKYFLLLFLYQPAQEAFVIPTIVAVDFLAIFECWLSLSLCSRITVEKQLESCTHQNCNLNTEQLFR